MELGEDVLSVIAQLKASQVSQAISGLMGQVIVMSSRQFMQDLLINFYQSHTVEGMDEVEEFQTAIESIDDVVAGTIYTQDLQQVVALRANDSSMVMMHNDSLPDSLFPIMYENITEITESTSDVNGYLVGPELVNHSFYVSMTRRLTENNIQFERGNITRDTVPQGSTVGYLTVVLNARSIADIIRDMRVESSGEMSLIELAWNKTGNPITPAKTRDDNSTIYVPSHSPSTSELEDDDPVYGTYVLDASCPECINQTFVLPDYAKQMFFNGSSGAAVNGDIGYMQSISAGYAPVNILDRQWGVVIFQPHDVVLEPLNQLRNMLLISVFVIGFAMCVGTFLLSSWAVKPITRLQAATERSTAFLEGSPKTPVRIWYKPWVKVPDERKDISKTDKKKTKKNSDKNGSQQRDSEKQAPADANNHDNNTSNDGMLITENNNSNNHDSSSSSSDDKRSQSNEKTASTGSDVHSATPNNKNHNATTNDNNNNNNTQPNSIIVFITSLGPKSKRFIKTKIFGKEIDDGDDKEGEEEEGFKIPDRVITRRWIKDELTDLTETFNGMTDELRRQYAFLEQRVAQRTKEIERARIVAESANEAKSLFIANITHELRTPLNGILGMTSVSMEERDPRKLRESLQVIFKSGELLLHLLTDLLSFSKNNVGNMELEEKEFMVPEVETQLNAIFAEQSKKNKIELSVLLETEDLQNVVLYGDVNRILQIVINLVSNSLKFTPKGGSVKVRVSSTRPKKGGGDAGVMRQLSTTTNATSVSTKENDNKAITASVEHRENEEKEEVLSSNNERSVVSSPGEDTNSSQLSPLKISTNETDEAAPSEEEIAETNNEEYSGDDQGADPNQSTVTSEILQVTFEVSDTGPGIAPHLQKRVFEPFVQGDLQFNERRGGAGLGLSICRQLAGLMSGSVDLESELGKGSTFTFSVPLNIVENPTYHQKTGAELESSMSQFETSSWQQYNNGSSSSGNGNNTFAEQFENLKDIEEDHENNTNYSNNRDSLVPLSSTADTSSTNTGSVSSPKRPPMSRNPSSRGEDDKKINFPVRVLVVEDNKVNQEVMIRMLKLEGLEDVKVANDGLEAVSSIRECVVSGEGMYDIIFMDVQMPNLDGIQATQIIRSELEYDSPIVAVSAFANPTNVQDCLASGMDKFLAKPLRRPQLHKVLLEVLTDQQDNSNS